MSEIMKTQGRSINQRHLERTIDCLSQGEIIVVPTEAGYCFAGKADLKKTHAQLLGLREAHPKNKPFSLLCKDAKQISSISQLSTSAYRILNKVLPGPFTLILPVHRDTPKNSTGEFRATVGVRMTAHPVTSNLLELLDSPLMVTSVTDAEELIKEGYLDDDYEEAMERWWTTAEGILAHKKGAPKILLAGEEPMLMRVSTIIDLSDDNKFKILRDGGWEMQGLGDVF